MNANLKRHSPDIKVLGEGNQAAIDELTVENAGLKKQLAQVRAIVK